MAECSKPNNDPPQSTRAARYLELFDLECPTSEAGVKALASEYDLKHGDIVSFDEYRDVDSYFAVCQDDGTITLVRNPDDSCSGYLSIPKEVLESVSDALYLYREVITESEAATGIINLTMSPHDKFVTDRFGHEIPADFLFDAMVTEGVVTGIGIQAPGSQWDTYEPLDSITRELFKQRYLSGSPIVSVRVWVDLTNGDEYERYLAKYGGIDCQFPEIPFGWRKETCQRGNRSWGWRFHGPQLKKEEAERSIREFLDGFTYQFVDSFAPFISSIVTFPAQIADLGQQF